MADIAEILITAKDATGSAFASVKDGVGGVKDTVGGLTSALGGLVAALGVGMFASAIKESIDYADKLNDLSKRTGMSVEALGGLGYAAQQSGVDLDKVAQGSQKLSLAMAEAAGGNTKYAAAFDAMGVSITNADGTLVSSEEALARISDRFASYADGPEKAALAQQIFGKSGAELIPLLDEGGDSLRDMIAEYQKYGGISEETAKRADAFNDTLAKIELIGGSFVRALASALLPTLQVLANIFVDLAGDGHDFAAVTEVIANLLKGLATVAIGVVAAFEAVGTAIGALAAAAVSIVKGDFTGAWDILKKGSSDAGAAVGKAMDDAAKVWNTSTVSMVTSSERDGPKASAPVVKATGDIKDAIVDLGPKIDDLKTKLAAVEGGFVGASTQTSNYDAAYNKLKGDLEAGKIITNDQIDAYLNTARALDDAKAKLELYNQDVKDAADYAKKLVDERNAWEAQQKRIYDATSDAITQREIANDQLSREIGLIGAGPDVMIAFNAQIEREKILRQEIDPEQQKRLLALVDETEQLRLQKIAVEDNVAAWQSMRQELAGGINNFIHDYIDGGLSAAFKRLWNNVLTWAIETFAQISAKQVILNFSGIMSPQASASILNTPTGGGSGILNTVLSAATGGIADTISGLSMAAADFTQLVGQGVGIMDAFGMAASGAGLTLGSLVPVIGGVVAAGMLAYHFLGSQGGGPKEGGFATTGATPGISGVDSSGRWFTPNNQDAALTSALGTINTQYNTILTALGGTNPGITFAQGYSTDPQGKAPSNVHTGVFGSGGQLFNAENANVGRSPEDLQAELQTQSMRALLAALQASELPTVIHDYLASIDVSTASVEQIQAALSHAGDLSVLVDQVSALPESMAQGLLAALGASDELDAKIAAFAKDFAAFSAAAGQLQDQLDRDPDAEAMKNLAAASATTFEKVGLARSALQDQLAVYDGSTQSTKDLTASTQSYIDAQVAALTQIAQMRDSLGTMFGDTQRMMDLAVMDTKEREQFFINEANQTIELLKHTTDPAEIDRLSRLINTDLTAAFNLMSPEEQRKQHDYLNSILTTAQSTANTQLDLAHDAVVDAGTQSTDILGQVQTALDEAAAKQQAAAQALIDAATAIKDAAQKQQTAAETQVSASAAMNAAAGTMTGAVNTPLSVAVEVSYVDSAGP